MPRPRTPTAVAEAAFGLQSVAVVAGNDVPGVPTDDGPWPRLTHLGQRHVADRTPMMRVGVRCLPDQRCRALIPSCVVMSLACHSRQCNSDVIVWRPMTKHARYWSCSRWANCSLPQSQNPGCKCSMCHRHRDQIDKANQVKAKKKRGGRK